MPVSSVHVLEQGPMLAALGKTAFRTIAQRVGGATPKPAATIPGPAIERVAAPPSAELIAAYVKHLGGDPKAYRATVPAHLFPQWVMPVASDALATLPYPMTRIVNAGCRLQVNARIPQGEPLTVRASLAAIDEDERRALITLRVTTGPKSKPDALEIEIRAIVPLNKGGNGKGTSGAKKREAYEKPRVPADAREIQRSRLPSDAGLSFAKLTGDFNPIHWIGPAAKAAGFRNVILHGYGTFARAIEALNRGVLSGDVSRLRVLDARFTRPLVLPHDIGFFISGEGASGELFVGDALGGPQFMSGHFETRPFEST